MQSESSDKHFVLHAANRDCDWTVFTDRIRSTIKKFNFTRNEICFVDLVVVVVVVVVVVDDI